MQLSTFAQARPCTQHSVAAQRCEPGPAHAPARSLRAYPHIQLRRLCAILHERTLPLASPAVATLLRQCMFHIGTLAADSKSSSNSGQCVTHLAWRTSWTAPGEVLEALNSELQLLAAELMDAKREHQQVLLLGEVAAYLADWSPGCKRAALRFADMTSRHADDMVGRLSPDSACTAAGEVLCVCVPLRPCQRSNKGESKRCL